MTFHNKGFIKTRDLRTEKLLELMLTVCFNVFLIIGVILIKASDGFTEQDEWATFTAGVFGCVVASVALTLFFKKFCRVITYAQDFYCVLLVLQTILIFLQLIFLRFGMTSLTLNLSFLKLFFGSLFAFVLISALATALARFVVVVTISLYILPIFIIGILVQFIGAYPFYISEQIFTISFASCVISFVIALVATALWRFENSPLVRLFDKRDLIVIVSILFFCFDARLSFNIHHANFYLGPVNSVLNGKCLLADSFSQYGVGVIYFLALCFRILHLPVSYEGLSAIVSMLYIVQYIALYYLLKYTVQSYFHSVAALATILLFNFVLTEGPSQIYPSTGPLRFGLPVLLLIFTAIKYSARERLGVAGEVSVVACSSIWSFETFFYCVSTYLAVLTCEVAERKLRREAVSFFLLRRVGVTLSAIILSHTLLMFSTFIFNNQLPKWDIYFDYIFLYSTGGFSALPIYPWSPWAILFFIYLTGLVSHGFDLFYFFKTEENMGRKVISLAFLFLGVAQSTYYISRSHPNNLLHVCVPAIVAAFYWYLRIQRSNWFPTVLRSFTRILIITAFLFVGITSIRSFNEKLENTAFQIFVSALSESGFENRRSLLQRLYYPSVHGGESVNSSLSLIEKHAPNGNHVMLFISYEETTEALMRGGKCQVLPISNLNQDCLNRKIVRLVLESTNDLKDGDIIFLDSNRDNLRYNLLPEAPSIAILVLEQIERKFLMTEIDRIRGVIVVKLTRK